MTDRTRETPVKKQGKFDVTLTKKPKAMRIDLKPNEMVVKAGDSNRLDNGTRIDGKFIITNQRIYFKSLNGHAEKYDLEILPSEIREVHFFNTGFLSPNGLNLILKGGDELRFSVKQRNSFGELINRMY